MAEASMNVTRFVVPQKPDRHSARETCPGSRRALRIMNLWELTTGETP